MIEIRRKFVKSDYPDKDGGYKSQSWSLFQDGIEVEGVYVSQTEVQAYTNLTSTRISKLSVYDFPADFVIILKKLEELGFWSIRVEISKSALGLTGIKIDTIKENEYLVKFVMKYDLSIWKEKYSFVDYRNEFSNILEGREIFNFKSGNDLQINNSWNRFDDEITSITFHYFKKYSIYKNIREYLDFLKDLHFQIVGRIENELNKNILNLTFNFPEELKVSCEQYLLYFAQFLRDLGINATPNLKEEAGKVLFSITPTDDIEALDKIREALAIYLSLSSNPIPHSTSDRTVDMILSGARANAKHLESQLELAVAKLQFKEATLELKDATIEQNHLALWQRDETIKDLKEMLAKGNIFEESLEKVDINGEVVEETSLYRFSREDDIEVVATPVLDENKKETKIGLVKFHEVTKLKDYGVSLDLPKAIRNLINYFKRDKNNG